MMHKAWCSIEEVPYCFPRPSIKFQGHKGQKIDDLDQIWARLLGRSQLSNPSDLPCFLTFCSTITTWKGPRKGHGKVIEFHSWISVWTMYMDLDVRCSKKGLLTKSLTHFDYVNGTIENWIRLCILSNPKMNHWLRAISQEMLKISILDMSLKITNGKLHLQSYISQGPMS